MKNFLSEVMETTIRSMIDSCATTAQICDRYLVTPYQVQKIRNKMKTERRLFDRWNPVYDSKIRGV